MLSTKMWSYDAVISSTSPSGSVVFRQALRRLGAGCHGSGGTACHGGMEGRGLACLGSLYIYIYGNGKLYIKLIAKLCNESSFIIYIRNTYRTL